MPWGSVHCIEDFCLLFNNIIALDFRKKLTVFLIKSIVSVLDEMRGRFLSEVI